MTMDVCVACGTPGVAKGQRRLLYNPGGVHLVSVLRDIMSEVFDREQIDSVLPPTPNSHASTSSSSTDSSLNQYTCRKCFRSLESYVKAKDMLRQNVMNSGKCLKLCVRTTTSQLHCERESNGGGNFILLI